MTPQSTFMIVVPLIAERRRSLECLLDSMNSAPGQVNPDNPIIPFAQFDQLHSARLLIIEALTGDDMASHGIAPYDWPPSLALLGEIDGCTQDFLAWIAVTASEGLRCLFSHCEGFDTHDGTLLDFLRQHETQPAASYVNWRGRTVTQVREEAHLQQAMADRLSWILEQTNDHCDVRSIRQQLLTFVQMEQYEGRLPLSDDRQSSWLERLHYLFDLLLTPVLLLLLSPLLLLASPFLAWRLRHLEKNDPVIRIRAQRSHIESLSRIEDIGVNNQFNVLGDVKPGWFRYWLLRAVMHLVDYASRHIYTRGYLGRVRSIHFARWVFLNKGRSVYFASLYDGSLESYMDDFINKVAFGLNLTFSHGVGYPRTRWMIKGGAEIEQEFKDTLRRHQLPSAVWYHAYPGLTALDMARNARIRQGLRIWPRRNADIRQWLSEI